MRKLTSPVVLSAAFSALAACMDWACSSPPSSAGAAAPVMTEGVEGSSPAATDSTSAAGPSSSGEAGQGSAARDGVPEPTLLAGAGEAGGAPAGGGQESAGPAPASPSEAAAAPAADPAEPSMDAATSFPVSAGTPTIYLAGDSTVQTYGAGQAPQQGWGQRIQEFFTDDVVFVNAAIGGRSSKSFIDEGRLDAIVAELEPGDYLFAQWGINDRYRSDPTRFTDPSTTFRDYLNQYIDAARSKNAIPVLVTPTPRLDFSDGEFHNDFVEYCAAIQQVGADTDTRVIDLQTAGLAYYSSIGFDEVVAEISLPPMDVLHFQANGALQMARLVAEGVKASDLPLAAFVR